jgi:hypothetical protein
LGVLPATPPNELDDDAAEAEFTGFSSKIELPVLTLPPILPFGLFDDSIEAARPSSLEVPAGGDSSVIDIKETPLAENDSAAALFDVSHKMPYETVRESPIPPSRSRSRSRNGQSSIDLSKPRAVKPPSQKAMLSRALQKANTAVQLDNAQNFEGARESYAEACDLLQHVLLKTSADEDKKKLEAIVSPLCPL